MTEVWLVLALPVLAWLVARFRAKRLVNAVEASNEDCELVSVTEMSMLVKELSPSIRSSSRVTSPNLISESSHVWNSPSGKRVYMN